MKRSDGNATWADTEGGEEAPGLEVGRYRLEHELARGGLGKVLQGYDSELQRVVAIKTLIRTSPAARARFQRETLLTARLQHPNIVAVYDGGEDDDGNPFLAMRLVEGRTLAEEIAQRPGLNERLALLPQVIAACNAVAYAHHQEVAHRDLKPHNLLIGAYGEAVVIDWGLAKDLASTDDPTVEPTTESTSGNGGGSVTRVGAVVGTPAYMPPEQAGARAVGVTADVYALGAVLYELLSGRPPYDGEADVIAAVLRGPPRPVERAASGAPRDLVAVVAKAMDRDPARRYSDAGALAVDLERFLAGRFVEARHYPLAERTTRWIAANRSLFALAAVTTVALAAGVGSLVRARDRALADRHAERAARDQVSVEQARILAARDPERALELLDSLSPAVPRDGVVRTIAATAWATPAAVTHPPPSGDDTLWGVGFVGDEALAAWTSGTWALGRSARALDPRAQPRRQFVADGERAVWTEPGGVRWRRSSGEERLVPMAEAPVHLVRDGLGNFFAAFAHDVVAIGPDGDHVALGLRADSASVIAGDGRGGVWAADNHRRAGVHHDPVRGVSAWIEVGQPYGVVAGTDWALFLGADPALVRARRVGDALEREVLPVPADWLEGGVVAGDLAFVGGSEVAAYVIDPAGGVRVVSLPARPRVFDARGDRVVVGLESGEIAVISVPELSVRVLSGIDGPVRHLAVSPDGTRVLAGSPDALVEHRLVDDGVVAVLPGRVRSIHEQGGALYVGWEAGLDRVGADGVSERLAARRTETLVPCGGALWAGGEGGLWTVDGEARVDMAGIVAGLACADGHTLVAGTMEGMAWVVDAVRGVATSSWFAGGEPGVHDVAVDSAGRVVLPGTRIEVVDLATGRSTTVPGPELGTDVETDGEHTWAGTWSGELWEITPTPHLVYTMPDAITGIGAIPGRGVLLGDAWGGLRWMQDGEATPLSGHSQYVAAVAPRPGGRFAATGGWDTSIWLWDLSVAPPAGRRLVGHHAAVVTLTWSADGSTLYSGDRSGEVRVWTDPLPEGGEALSRAIAARLGRP